MILAERLQRIERMSTMDKARYENDFHGLCTNKANPNAD